MTKEMIVSSNDHETTVAILEDDQLVELFIERERNRGVVGNVYKGRVSKVLPGMQSAFVDLGLERDGFLYVTDVVNPQEMFESLEDDEQPAAAVAAASAAAADAAAAAAQVLSAEGAEEHAVAAAVRPPRTARRATRTATDTHARSEATVEPKAAVPIGRASKTC